MKHTRSDTEIVGRRGELLAEFFLQELNPLFISRPSANLGFDFFVGFHNPDGGTNTIGVVVKATAREISSVITIDTRSVNRWAHSNIPSLLLVAQVKFNKLYYAWPVEVDDRHYLETKTIAVPLTEVNPDTTRKLHKQLIAAPHHGSQPGTRARI